MINKKNLWFLTLFSLILVLSIYYITMPSELLIGTEFKPTAEKDTEEVSIEESDILVALRVEKEEQEEKEIEDLKTILTNTDKTVEEKNNAFEKIKSINSKKSEEEKLEKKIKEQFDLNSFVKIDGDQIRVVVASKESEKELANKIMRCIQEEYDKKMYISVKFQK